MTTLNVGDKVVLKDPSKVDVRQLSIYCGSPEAELEISKNGFFWCRPSDFGKLFRVIGIGNDRGDPNGPQIHLLHGNKSLITREFLLEKISS